MVFRCGDVRVRLWGEGPITRVNIKDVRRHNLRMPWGNEEGAIHGEWLPGGLLPSGGKEAVIDSLPKSGGFYDELPVLLNL